MTSSLTDSKNKDRLLATYVISFLAASLPATLAVGHTNRDSEEKETATRKLYKLKQTMSAIIYMTKFQSLSV